MDTRFGFDVPYNSSASPFPSDEMLQANWPHFSTSDSSFGLDRVEDVPMQLPYGLSPFADALFANGSSSDNAHLPHSLPFRSSINMTSDGYILTPQSSTEELQPDSQSAAPSPAPASASDAASPANSARRPSSGRALVPNQSASTAFTGAVPNVSSPQNEQGPFLAGGGPTGRSYVVPPRPKPGRKPATDEPASKRKAQNRESQRAFRARKAQKVQDLTDQVEEIEQRHRAELNEKLALIHHLEVRIRDLEYSNDLVTKDRNYWKSTFEQLRDSQTPAAASHTVPHLFNGQPMLYMNPTADARVQSPSHASAEVNPYGTPSTADNLGCGNCKPDSCACMDEITNDMTLDDAAPSPMEAVPLPSRHESTPMTGIERTPKAQSDDETDFARRETDFTAKFTRAPPRPTTNFTAMSDLPEDQLCGWCDGKPELCLCRDQSLRPEGLDGMATLSRVPSSESTRDFKSSVTSKGPGSCADCQANPRQRAWCQGVARVAQLRAEATPPNSRRNSAKSLSLDIMEPKIESRIDHNRACASPITGERSIGCSEAFKLLDGRVPMDSDNMDWRNLKPVPHVSMHRNERSDSFTMEPGMYSAMELDASSILTTLQHSRRPLEPRPSDGTHASLVRIAEERRRETLSPMTGPESPAGLIAVSAFNMSR